MPSIIDSLVISLGLDSSNFNKGQKEASEQFKKTQEDFKKGGGEVERVARGMQDGFRAAAREVLGFLAVLAGARSLKDFTSQMIDADAAIGRFSASMGSTPERLTAVTAAISRHGGSADAAAASMRRLSDAFEDLKAGKGNSELFQFMGRGGVQFDYRHGVTDDVLKGINRNLVNIQKKYGSATASYWGRRIGLDDESTNFFMQDPKQVNAQIEESRRLGVATSASAKAAQDLLEKWRALKESAQDLGRQILVSLAPPIERALKGMVDWVEKNKEWLAQKLSDGISAIGNAINALVSSQDFKDLVAKVSNPATWKPFTDWVKDMGSDETWKGFRKAIIWLSGQLHEIIQMFDDLKKAYAWLRQTDADQVAKNKSLPGTSFGDLTPQPRVLPGQRDPMALSEGPYANPSDESTFGARMWRRLKRAVTGGDRHPRPGKGHFASNSAELFKVQRAQLIKEGVSPANADAAAAILGGQIVQESGGDPTKVHDHGTGYGLYGARLERRARMFAWLAANGYSRDSAEGQARYMAHEAMTSYPKTRNVLMAANATNLDASTHAVTLDFEAPKAGPSANYGGRIGNARAIYKTAASAPGALGPVKTAPMKRPNPYGDLTGAYRGLKESLRPIPAGAFVGAGMGAPGMAGAANVANDNRVHHSSAETNIGNISIHTPSGDPQTIAKSIGPAIKRHATALQANYGQN